MSRKFIRDKSDRENRLEALKNEILALEKPPDMFRKDFIKKLNDYRIDLIEHEYAKKTIEKYLRNARWFAENYTSDDYPLRKEHVLEMKEYLLDEYEAVQTINSYITTVGKFLHYCEQGAYTVVKVKGHTSNVLENRIYEHEYKRMLRRAKANGHMQLYYIIKVMGSTGVRVNELKSFTVKSIQADHIKINNKGRIRLVPIPGPLVRELRAYAKEQRIEDSLFDLPYESIYRGLKVSVN